MEPRGNRLQDDGEIVCWRPSIGRRPEQSDHKINLARSRRRLVQQPVLRQSAVRTLLAVSLSYQVVNGFRNFARVALEDHSRPFGCLIRQAPPLELW